MIEWRWRGDPQSSVIRGFQAQLTNHDATDDSESFDLDTTVPQYYSHDVLMCCRNEMQKRDNNYMTWHWNVAVAQQTLLGCVKWIAIGSGRAFPSDRKL